MEEFVFVLPRRRVYNALLTELLPEFLMSHNQVSSLNRSFSNPPEPPKRLIENPESHSIASPRTPDSDTKEEVMEAQSQPTDFEETQEPQAESEDIFYSKDMAGMPVIDSCTFAKCVSIIITTGNISESLHFMLFCPLTLSPGNDFHFSAVTTFSYFCSLSELLNEIQRQLGQIRENAGPNLVEVNTAIVPALIRTSGVLRQLADAHLSYFRQDQVQLKLLLGFIGSTITPIIKKAGTDLKEYIIKRASE